MNPTRDFYTNYRTAPYTRKYLRVQSKLIRTYVTVGSNILEWLKNEQDYHSSIAIISLYTHILEQADAASILIRKGCCEPCKPLARSATESTVLLHYLIDSNTTKRAISYTMSFAIHGLTWNERLDPEHSRGADIRSKFKQDRLGSKLESIQKMDAQKARETIESEFCKPPYGDIWAKWKDNLGLSWYSLDSGKRDLASLAHSIGRGHLYEYFFRAYSEYTHSGTRGSFTNEGGLLPVRSPTNSYQITKSFHALLDSITIDLINKRAPSEMGRFVAWSRGILDPAIAEVEYFKLKHARKLELLC